MADPSSRTIMSNFRHLFWRGLAIVLPTVLSFWLLLAVYNFIDGSIAAPLNAGVRSLVVAVSPWPEATEEDFLLAEQSLTARQRALWQAHKEELRNGEYVWTQANERAALRQWIKPLARKLALERWWRSVGVGAWAVLDLVGLVVAIILIYVVGALLGSFIGRQLYHRGEQFFARIPLLGRVYPAIKQVTDFFVGENKQLRFNRVLAVQYPRMGVWSVALATGDGMAKIVDATGEPCISVFLPSSPTPFTGYVVTVPVKDTLELPITIEEALRFIISGGVVMPPSQVRTKAGQLQAAAVSSTPGPDGQSPRDAR
ncbi:MAG: DUF502 domain-containing protein [Phycisphaeraceae bacterium]|nr:DUF502 domain-containing protein [Phycisphaeraceae bacterium]